MEVISQLQISPMWYSWLIPMHLIGEEKLNTMVENGTYPTICSLWPALLFAIVFGFARSILQYYLFQPFAMKAMKLKKVSLTKDHALDEQFSPRKEAKKEAIVAYCKESGKKQTDVEKYLSMRKKNSAIDKKVVKFVESLWRFIFYFIFCVIGIGVLFFPDTAVWVKDVDHHWIGWPHLPLPRQFQFYYLIELGCYVHQLMWTEVSRSDAAEMIIHHITTILLILMSYLGCLFRIGTSILLVHDLADIFLESAKCFNYASKAKGNAWMSKICDTLFGLFTVTFFVTRLVIYPRYLWYSLVFDSVTIMGYWHGYWAYAILLTVLQVLHVFWFYLIVKMVIRLFTTGIEKDERSDDEEEADKEVATVSAPTAGGPASARNKAEKVNKKAD